MHYLVKEYDMKKNIAGFAVLAVVMLAALVSCGGPAEIGYAELTLWNGRGVELTKIELDGVQLLNADGTPVQVVANDLESLVDDATTKYLAEFVTEGEHTFKGTWADDVTVEVTEELEVNKAVTIGFEEASAPAKFSTIGFTNSTGSSVYFIVVRESRNDEDPIGDYNYEKIFSAGLELPLLGLPAGQAQDLKVYDEGTFHLYTSVDGETWDYQGTVTLTLEQSTAFTAH